LFVRDSSAAKSVEHTPGFATALPATNVRDVERALSDWFGAEVILTSSGRAAILLYLTALGFDRYLNRIAVPRMISSCVLDAVIRRGFPVDAEGEPASDARVLYHQYGVPQIEGTPGIVIEDICHAFFSTATSGSRAWWGEVGVFSLPKFFSLNGMGGGLVMVRSSRARQLREMREQGSQRESMENDRHLAVLHSGDPGRDRSAIEQFYLSRLLNPRILDHQTGGMPSTAPEILTIGEKRQEVVAQLLENLGNDALPAGWSELLRGALPFALPVFGDPPRLRRLDAMLAEIGVKAGVYKIDVARNNARPRYQSAVLVPCHHEIPASMLNDMIGVLRSFRTAGGPA
jgi:hypothetical protein